MSQILQVINSDLKQSMKHGIVLSVNIKTTYELIYNNN